MVPHEICEPWDYIDLAYMVAKMLDHVTCLSGIMRYMRLFDSTMPPFTM